MAMEEEAREEDCNRFNDLPDDILHHILSFLHDTKFTVQASVLSKRWNSLWKDLPVPALHLHEASFHTAESLRGFVRNFLQSLRHATLDTVSFSYVHEENDYFINIIGSEVARDAALYLMVFSYGSAGPRVLSIRNLCGDGCYFMFKSMEIENRCDDLEALEMVGCSGVQITEVGLFRMLTTLDLRNCELGFYPSSSSGDNIINNDGGGDDLFANLGRLECLKLVGCKLEPTGVCLKLSGQHLREVRIVDCSDILVSQVSAPKLESFDFSVDEWGLVKLHSLDLPSLGRARIRLWTSSTTVVIDGADDDGEVQWRSQKFS